jgi:hypothetical protein
MMNIKHARKAETFNIDGMKIVVEAYGKSYQGNPAGFSVKIRGTEAHYHVNVLEINDAIFRGLHKYLQRELGLSDMVTYMNVRTEDNVPMTLCIKARDGQFTMQDREGFFTVTEQTSCSDDACGLRHWEIAHNNEKVCTVCRHKNDDERQSAKGNRPSDLIYTKPPPD